jgi:pimeloyl-ACP methyl ester carboxylesterase
MSRVSIQNVGPADGHRVVGRPSDGSLHPGIQRRTRRPASADAGDFEWDLRESGPADAARTVLLLPGGMCTATFYEDVMGAPAMAAAPVRLVAATVPGFGRTRHPADLSVENYARLAADLAADLGADVVAGHSYGANIAIEMAATRRFTGRLVLLSPSFSRADEFKELGVLDRVGRVPGVGHLAWALALKAMPKSMKDSFDPARRDALVAELANNDPVFCRRTVRRYFEYLDQHGSLVSRLCDSGVEVSVVFGEHDEVGLTDEERRGLDACPSVTMATVADAGHMMLTEQPDRTAQLILAALPAGP